jgi:hypothetical protein
MMLLTANPLPLCLSLSCLANTAFKLFANFVINRLRLCSKTLVFMPAFRGQGVGWAAALLVPGKGSVGAAPILKEALQLAVYLPVVTATYFLVTQLLNVILPRVLYLSLSHLKFASDFDLDSLKVALMGFSFVSAIISLMILQLIFTIPQLIAKLIGYSETDFGVGSAATKVENQTMNKNSLSATNTTPPQLSTSEALARDDNIKNQAAIKNNVGIKE